MRQGRLGFLGVENESPLSPLPLLELRSSSALRPISSELCAAFAFCSLRRREGGGRGKAAMQTRYKLADATLGRNSFRVSGIICGKISIIG